MAPDSTTSGAAASQATLGATPGTHSLPGAIVLDASQQTVVDASATSSLAVLGAPGSGRTTTLIELVAAEVEQRGTDPERILAIGANRRTAAMLRDRLQARLNRAVRGQRLGRTLPSIAMEILAEDSIRTGAREPRLLTGAQQDAILRDLLEGDVVDYETHGVWRWGAIDPETLRLNGFRDEVRALLAAMVEQGVTPRQLRELGTADDTDPDWLAKNRFRIHWPEAADFADRYFDVLESGYEGVLDTPMAARDAARVLASRVPGTERLYDDLALIVVDDAQELTASARALMLALHARGARLVTFGDPDAATGAFHGGEATFASGWTDAATGRVVSQHVLHTVYRHPQSIRDVVRALTNGLGAAGAGEQRQANAASAPSPTAAATTADVAGAFTVLGDSDVDEAAHIVQYLRWNHLMNGIAWRDMAVIARSGGALPALARVLERDGVPVTQSTPNDPANDATVRAILNMGTMIASNEIAAPILESVLQSPLVGIDPLQMRALRRLAYFAHDELRLRTADATQTPQSQSGTDAESLRDVADAAGARSHSSGAAVLARAIAAEIGQRTPQTSTLTLQAIIDANRRGSVWPDTIAKLRSLVDALSRMQTRFVRQEPIDSVLFEAWADEKRAERWQEIALSNEPGASELNRRLDAVVTLFERAKRLVEREPGTALESFIARWQAGGVQEDTLIARSRPDAVTLTTPAGSAGQQWPVVVVAGVTDGVWPNLRLRDSLLGATRLAEARDNSTAISLVDRRKAVLFDETRMLVSAVSRAQQQLLVTAVASADQQPSSLWQRMPLASVPDDIAAPFAALATIDAVRTEHESAVDDEQGATQRQRARRLDLDGLAAYLRRVLIHERLLATKQPINHEEAIQALARLAHADVSAADPKSWFGIREVSTTAPLVEVRDGQATLSLSPSAIGKLRDCPVEAFLDQHASSMATEAQWLGTMIHDLAEHEDDYPSHESMLNEALARVDAYPVQAEWMREVNRTTVRTLVTGLWDYLKEAGDAIGHEQSFVSPHTVSAIDKSGELVDVEVRMRGKIDRTEMTQDGVRIVDFKTSKQADTKANDNAQLQSYQLACVRGDIADVPANTAFASAALVYPRITSGRGTKQKSWKETVQKKFDDSQLAEIVTEFTRLAFARVGINLQDVPPPQEHGEFESPHQAAESTGELPNLANPPAFQRDVEHHCAKESHGGFTHSCRLHTIAEVCD